MYNYDSRVIFIKSQLEKWKSKGTSRKKSKRLFKNIIKLINGGLTNGII